MTEASFGDKSKERALYKVETVNGDVDTDHIGNQSIDTVDFPIVDFPIIESTNNAIIWPEEVKGGIDLTNTYEINSVPENPDTPLESLSFLEQKGVIPKY